MSGSEDAFVLVVDDEPELAELYADQLSASYTVHTAYDGEEALERIDESVDVVLLDRRMPDRSGEDLLAEIRERSPSVYVAMVTAVMPDFDIIDMEFDDYLVKPVTRDELHSTVEGLLVRSSYQRLVQRYFTLTSKYAALKTHKTEKELEESDEFARLKDELDEVQTELDRIVAEFGPEDFHAVYHDLS